jgi:formate-dependent nitrite reductase cytochrome c552 subunit
MAVEVCAGCHEVEASHFDASRHGMRRQQGLGSMRVADARLVMKAEARARELSCTSCHSAHSFDTRRAAVDACMQCHDDAHTRAYLGSPHHRLWEREIAGELPPGSGVSCATCHLPRVEVGEDGSKRVLVEHNQNANLRPNDKFTRSVCLDCHGLGFTLDALADVRLLRNNFAGRSQTHVPSLDMVRKRAADL